MRDPGSPLEEHLGVLIVEGQRHEVTVRSEPDDEGIWHNALLFRRDGTLHVPRARVAGVDWHVPPGIALTRARELQRKEQIELYRRTLRPRPPAA